MLVHPAGVGRGGAHGSMGPPVVLRCVPAPLHRRHCTTVSTRCVHYEGGGNYRCFEGAITDALRGPLQMLFMRCPHPATHTLQPTLYTLYQMFKSCTLYPIFQSLPYTLYPAPCSPYPILIPYTLYPIPYTLYPIPYTLYPIPYTPYPLPYTLCRSVLRPSPLLPIPHTC